jgi:hypothetical protein
LNGLGNLADNGRDKSPATSDSKSLPRPDEKRIAARTLKK